MSSSAAAQPLSHRLRTGTQALHRAAEGTPFVQALLGGRLDTAAYALMLRNLEPLYRALESGLRSHAAHPALRPILAPALFRGGALAQDLVRLHGADWAHAIPLMPAARAYVARLESLTAADPALLAAHAYVRYLGDLYGGQLFARLLAHLQAAVGSQPAGKLHFHDFGDPAAVARLASALRRGLDALPADGDLAEHIVAEAQAAFERHVLLFGELAAACGLGDPGAVSRDR